MVGLCEVAFRGQRFPVVIEFDEGVDRETHTRVIGWHFQGLNTHDHEALAITADEERAVFEQLERQLARA